MAKIFSTTDPTLIRMIAENERHRLGVRDAHQVPGGRSIRGGSTADAGGGLCAMSEIFTDYAPREQCCYYTDSGKCDRFGGSCPNDVCIELDAKDAQIEALVTACKGLLGFLKACDMGGDWCQDNYPSIKQARAAIKGAADA